MTHENQAAIKLEDYMEDGQGRLVPKERVKTIDKLRNDLVLDMIKRALVLKKEMIEFKVQIMSEVSAFVDLSAEKYDVKMRGKKGNLTLFSYDGQKKVQIQIADYLVFDERLQVAKKMIDKCLISWTEGGRSEIKTIINDAFQVDKEGMINTKRILSLRRHDIKDKLWCKAMTAISDSLQVSGSKSYFRVYERTIHGNWKHITLDMASL